MKSSKNHQSAKRETIQAEEPFQTKPNKQESVGRTNREKKQSKNHQKWEKCNQKNQ